MFSIPKYRLGLFFLVGIGLSSAIGLSTAAPVSDRANKHYIIASSNNFPPVNALDENGQLVGFGRDIADAVIRSIGGTQTHIHSNIWTEVLEWLANGQADFIHDTGYSLERTAYLGYSDPILTMPEEIFVRVDRFDISGLEGLKDHKVACVKNHVTHLYLNTLPSVTCQVVATPVDGLYALINGDVDVFIFPRQILLNVAQHLNLIDRIKVVGDPVRELKWHMTVRKGDQEMLDLLNEGIAEIKASGAYDKIYDHWFGRIRTLGYSGKELAIIITVVMALSLSLGALVVVVLYNRRMTKVQSELHYNERRFRDFAESSADWLWETDKEHRFIFVSEGLAQAAMRLKAEDVIGKKRTDFAEEDLALNPKKWKQHLADLDAHRPIKDFNYSIAFKNSKNREFLIRANPIFDASGTFMGYRGVGQDITERKRVEKDLKHYRDHLEEQVAERTAEINASHRLLKKTFDSLNEAVFVVDAKTRNIINCNQSAESMFGYTRDEIIGNNTMFLHVSPETYREFGELLFPALEKHGEFKAEFTLRRSDGSLFKSNHTVTEILNEAGERSQLVSTIRDITERKKLDDQLIQNRKQLEATLNKEREFSTLQRKFISLVSHEFRTPLTIIDGVAQRLVRKKTELTREYVLEKTETIRTAVRRMTELIENTLYAARLEEGVIDVHLKPMNLKAMILDFVTLHGELSPSHNITADIDGLPQNISADEKLLGIVFTNLLSNAIKFSPNAPDIEIKGSCEGGYVIISVTDHGVGIPEKDLPHMLTRFFRASTADGIKGTGIGLSISREFIELHGGDISIDSVQGEGTTFTVRLPWVKAT